MYSLLRFKQIDYTPRKSHIIFSLVCDGKTTVDQPCDELCGGAGCDKCGGLSCLNGALSRADEAVKAANNADALLIEKDGKAEDGK